MSQFKGGTLGDNDIEVTALQSLGCRHTLSLQDRPYNFKSDIWSLGVVLYEVGMRSPTRDPRMRKGAATHMTYSRMLVIHERTLVNEHMVICSHLYMYLYTYTFVYLHIYIHECMCSYLLCILDTCYLVVYQ